MKAATIHEILQNHLPAAALQYCLNLWTETPFQFKTTKKRHSKSGDFTCRQGHTPRITVNGDLHPLEFLITYVHEVAHLRVHQTYGFKAEAHGTEWKLAFQNLFQPLLTETIFPDAVLSVLQRHMSNPKASTYSDSELTNVLRKQDPRKADIKLVGELPEGSVFDLNGRWFKKGKLQRTRVICQELNSRRRYLVPADAPVAQAQLAIWG